MSPRLRPGLVVVRRDDRHLQVGLEPPRRVVLPDLPDVRRLLDDLGEERALGVLEPGAADALARLERAGLLAPALPATGPVARIPELKTPPTMTDVFFFSQSGRSSAAAERSSSV